MLIESEILNLKIIVLFDSLGRKICTSVELTKALDEQKINRTNFQDLVKLSTSKKERSLG